MLVIIILVEDTEIAELYNSLYYNSSQMIGKSFLVKMLLYLKLIKRKVKAIKRNYKHNTSIISQSYL